MIDAHLLKTMPAAGAEQQPVLVYSPWFPREGDNGRFTLEVVAISEATITLEVFHKNTEDTGDGTAYGDATNILFDNKSGRTTQEWTGLKELVRFRYEVLPHSEAPDGTVGWVLFRLLRPVWFESVKA